MKKNADGSAQAGGERTTGERGRSRGGKRMTAAAIQKLAAGYFARCDELQRKPTWQGLAGHVGVTSETLTAWFQGELGRGVREALQQAADELSDRLQQRTDSMAMLSIKQPIFGGFADRTKESGGGQISIEVTVGGKEAAETAEYGG